MSAFTDYPLLAAETYQLNGVPGTLAVANRSGAIVTVRLDKFDGPSETITLARTGDALTTSSAGYRTMTISASAYPARVMVIIAPAHDIAVQSAARVVPGLTDLTTVGTSRITVPNDVYAVTAILIGGGGGGGGSTANAGGGGGGGAELAIGTFPLVPGSYIEVTVGAGGAGGAAGQMGGLGTSSRLITPGAIFYGEAGAEGGPGGGAGDFITGGPSGGGGGGAAAGGAGGGGGGRGTAGSNAGDGLGAAGGTAEPPGHNGGNGSSNSAPGGVGGYADSTYNYCAGGGGGGAVGQLGGDGGKNAIGTGSTAGAGGAGGQPGNNAINGYGGGGGGGGAGSFAGGAGGSGRVILIWG